MIVWWARIATAVAIVLGLALSVQSCRLADRDARIATETSRAALIAAGFREAAVARRPETVIQWRTLRLAAEAARAAGAVVAGAVHVEGGEVAVDLSDRVAANPPATPGGGGSPSGCPSQPVLVSGGHEGVVALDPGGAAHWRGRMWVGTRLPHEDRPAVVDLPVVSASVTVDPVIGDAWRYYQGRNRRFRVDVLAGVSAGTDGGGAVEGGVVAGRGRLGWYALGEYRPATGDVRGHGGLRLSIRR